MAISGEGRVFELLRCPDNESWLEARTLGVGGSDVAAIMGLSPYRSAYEVWAEKTGLAQAPDLSGRESVQWGNILEPVVGDHYRGLHPEREVRRVNALCRSLSRPWAQASLDYEVRDPEMGWGVLEIKTVGLRRASDWEAGVPIYYQTQIAHYMGVTGRPFADVAVLVGGQEYREYRVVRDEGDVEAVREAVDSFWHANVEGGVAPDPSGSAGDSRALLAAHPDPGEVEQALSCDVPELSEWLEAREAEERAKERLSAATARLKGRIGDARGIETERGCVKWLRGEAAKLDTARLKAEQPDLYKRYTKQSARDGGLRWSPRKDS